MQDEYTQSGMLSWYLNCKEQKMIKMICAQLKMSKKPISLTKKWCLYTTKSK